MAKNIILELCDEFDKVDQKNLIYIVKIKNR